jgi:ABC-2 type transport system ATP-binding protein
MIAIETKNLSRSYRTYEKAEGLMASLKGFTQRKYIEKQALKATDLSLKSGQIIGLVGANGAGKTTLLKILSGLIPPSTGEAKVLGFTPFDRKPEFLRQISLLLGQKNQLWWDLSPSDSFQLLGDIYNLEPGIAKKRSLELADILDAKHVLNTQLRRLSLGERMKMELIGSLLHEPKVLFLDEPTIGLDIVAQSKIRQFLLHYVHEKQPTIILTSHYMDDIAQLASQLLLMSQGKIVYNGSVNEFLSKNEERQKIKFSLSNPLGKELKIQIPTGAAITLHQGQQEFEIEIEKKLLPMVLNYITQLPGLMDLKFEEVNFENVIHRFLQKELRLS